MRNEMDYENLTEKIIKCAFTVYNRMGCGFLESVYENCMVLELAAAGLHAESQKPINVFYGGHLVGKFSADILVNDTIIIELKSVRQLNKTHEVQLVNYLVATGKPIGFFV